VQAKTFRFELRGTSREPGVCMNFPHLVSGMTPDLAAIPLPKRTGRSLIADAWKTLHGIEGVADDRRDRGLRIGSRHADSIGARNLSRRHFRMSTDPVRDSLATRL